MLLLLLPLELLYLLLLSCQKAPRGSKVQCLEAAPLVVVLAAAPVLPRHLPAAVGLAGRGARMALRHPKAQNACARAVACAVPVNAVAKGGMLWQVSSGLAGALEPFKLLCRCAINQGVFGIAVYGMLACLGCCC